MFGARSSKPLLQAIHMVTLSPSDRVCQLPLILKASTDHGQPGRSYCGRRLCRQCRQSGHEKQESRPRVWVSALQSDLRSFRFLEAFAVAAVRAVLCKAQKAHRPTGRTICTKLVYWSATLTSGNSGRPSTPILAFGPPRQ